MSNTFITSDLHLNHKKILQFSPKRKEILNCETLEEMNESLIKHWNEAVKPEDTIYHLGDFSFGSTSKTHEILERLNGNKIFILGNHDRREFFISKKPTFYLEEEGYSEGRELYGEIHQYLEIKYNNFDIILFHFPIVAWNKMEQGSLHFFGHCHGSYNPDFNKSLDCGFDNHFKILKMEEAIEIADSKPLYKRSYHR